MSQPTKCADCVYSVDNGKDYAQGAVCRHCERDKKFDKGKFMIYMLVSAGEYRRLLLA
jgi:hypothetical protein